MIITQVKEKERNSASCIKKLLFFGALLFILTLIFCLLHIFQYVKVLKYACSIVVILENDVKQKHAPHK